MQETIKENTNTFGKNAMTYGAITGFSLVIISLLFYSFHSQNSQYQDFFIYLILAAGIYVGTKSFRDKSLAGYMKYSKALGSGVLISLFASLILAFYYYIFYKMINPEGIEQYFKIIEDAMFNKGINGDQIETTMKLMKTVTTPATFAFGYIFSITIWGTVLSLILSFFVKKDKEQEPFDEAMNEIEN